MARIGAHLIGSCILALLLGGAASAAGEGGAAREAGEFERYTEKIPGTVVSFEMMPVPGGELEPRGEGDARRETSRVRRFWIGKMEVTWNEYDIWRLALDLPEEEMRARAAAAKLRPSKAYGVADFGFGHDGYPCIGITRHAAEMYCKWLSEKTGRKYRLPTEEEWEWACRGGEAGGAAGGTEIERRAWCAENSEEKTQPVGKKEPNGYGVHDMLGNAAEWVSGDDETPVARGGSWRSAGAALHCGYREKQSPAWNRSDPEDPQSAWWLREGDFVGFRVVREE